MAQDKPKTRLVDLVLNEVSFVPAGDNPEAKVMLMKSKPNQGKPMENENAEAVSKAVAAEVAKREALEKELEAIKEERALESVTKTLAAAGIKVDLAAHLRSVQKSNGAAFTAILAELTDLTKRLGAVEKLTTRIGGDPAPVTEKSQKLEAAVQAGMAKGLTRAQATTEALNANPELYEAR